MKTKTSKKTNEANSQSLKNLQELVNIIMLTYWGKELPECLRKADARACRMLDEIKGGKRIASRRLSETLESLCEATKEDDKTWEAIQTAYPNHYGTAALLPEVGL